MNEISFNEFSRRFTALVLNQTSLPKKHSDLHLLLYSATLFFQPHKSYTEKEVNKILNHWCSAFGKNLGLDHVSLRRALVDEGLLQRDPSGNHYTLELDNLPYQYDPAIQSLDLHQLIQQAMAEKERRKQEYLSSRKGN
ncbi:MAG: hypothetical protein Kow0088_01650 [Anaerolineales bacterium]